MPWSPPSLSVVWPPYFRPDPEGQGKLVELTAKARAARLITTRAAIEKLKPVFPFESAEAVLKALDKEAAEASKRSAEANHVLAQALKRDESDAGETDDTDEGGDDERGTPPPGA